jgi:NitT/TauT family transport system ATP-binding protein
VSYTIVDRLTVDYATRGGGVVRALDGLSFRMETDEVWGVVGPSGCGKSTLLKVLAGVHRSYDGEVSINGERPDPRRQSIGLIPQNYALLPWKRVEENIFLPQIVAHRAPNRNAAASVIDSLALGDLLHRWPHELSGGQQQRVALARSFIQSPDILLMDEPFSALDTQTAARSRALFQNVWRDNPVTTLLVTHNIDEAVALCSHIVVLSAAPGRVVALLETPSADEIRALIENLWL